MILRKLQKHFESYLCIILRELTDELYFGDMASSSTIMYLKVLVFFQQSQKQVIFLRLLPFQFTANFFSF